MWAWIREQGSEIREQWSGISKPRSSDSFYCAPTDGNFLHHLRWGRRLRQSVLTRSENPDLGYTETFLSWDPGMCATCHQRIKSGTVSREFLTQMCLFGAVSSGRGCPYVSLRLRPARASSPSRSRHNNAFAPRGDLTKS